MLQRYSYLNKSIICCHELLFNLIYDFIDDLMIDAVVNVGLILAICPREARSIKSTALTAMVR